MKIILIVVLFFTCFTFSQETTSKDDKSGFQFKSHSHAIGFYKLEKLKGKSSISASFQLTFQIDKHLLASSFALGSGILNENDILKNTIHSFADINILYGREFQIIDDVIFDIFSGIGYLEQTKLKNSDQGANLNIPIRAKLMFLTSKRTRFGFLSQLNFNSINDISMYQFFLQFEL
nr:hypothetical protein [uncultured Psychroserpens sp.]